MKEKKPAANRIAGNNAFRTPDRPGMPQERENSMAIGFRAYKEFERPAPELVEAFRGIPSSNIGDCTQRMNCMFDGIRPFNDLPLVGTVNTICRGAKIADLIAIGGTLDYVVPDIDR